MKISKFILCVIMSLLTIPVNGQKIRTYSKLINIEYDSTENKYIHNFQVTFSNNGRDDILMLKELLKFNFFSKNKKIRDVKTYPKSSGVIFLPPEDKQNQFLEENKDFNIKYQDLLKSVEKWNIVPCENLKQILFVKLYTKEVIILRANTSEKFLFHFSSKKHNIEKITIEISEKDHLNRYKGLIKKK